MVHFPIKIKGSLRILAALSWCVMLAACMAENEGDAPATAKTASIEGVVREQGTEATIVGASVFLVGGSDQPQSRANTDTDGRFALHGLEPGRHLVGVVREGFVIPERQNIAGYPYLMAPEEKLSNVVLYLIPSGTIAGRVLGSDGKPANHVEVQLLQNVYVMGQQQWTLIDRGGTLRNVPVVTNERGEFRAVGVDPGEYVLRFVPRALTVESVTRRDATPAPLLYPAGRDLSKAGMVEVVRGRESLVPDVTIKNERRGWIRAVVVNESGEALEGLGEWEMRPPGWIGAEYPLAEKRVVGQYHEFQPDSRGTYDVIATWPSRGGLLAATTRVDFRDADVEVKMRVVKPNGKLSGQIVFQEDNGGQRPLAAAEVAIGPKVSYFARSNAAGALMFPDVYAGSYQLGYVRGIPENSFVLSVTQAGRDVLREGITVGAEDMKLDVVVSGGAGLIEGNVLDASGAPLHNALVALVPEPPLSDRRDYYGAFRDTRTDQTGAFELRGITPGSYLAYAWRKASAGAIRNAAFMKAVAGKGTAVTLERGGSTSVDLRVVD